MQSELKSPTQHPFSKHRCFVPDILIVNIEYQKADGHQYTKSGDSEDKPKQRWVDSFQLLIDFQAIHRYSSTFVSEKRNVRRILINCRTTEAYL